jgi:hypothetical protein
MVGREITTRDRPGNWRRQPLGEIQAQALQRRAFQAGAIVEQAVVKLGGHRLQRAVQAVEVGDPAGVLHLTPFTLASTRNEWPCSLR